MPTVNSSPCFRASTRPRRIVSPMSTPWGHTHVPTSGAKTAAEAAAYAGQNWLSRLSQLFSALACVRACQCMHRPGDGCQTHSRARKKALITEHQAWRLLGLQLVPLSSEQQTLQRGTDCYALSTMYWAGGSHTAYSPSMQGNTDALAGVLCMLILCTNDVFLCKLGVCSRGQLGINSQPNNAAGECTEGRRTSPHMRSCYVKAFPRTPAAVAAAC